MEGRTNEEGCFIDFVRLVWRIDTLAVCYPEYRFKNDKGNETVLVYTTASKKRWLICKGEGEEAE